MIGTYIVTVRSPVPPDLAQRIAEAHARAIRAKLLPLEQTKATLPRRADLQGRAALTE